MIEKLELNHLRMLSALYEQGTVSAAAEALDVSQQAVSLQLKRVREILGDPLFVRTGHGMVPTAYGQLIQPHVRQLLALIHAMPMPTSIALEDMERTLSISATDHAQRIIIGDLIHELRRAPCRLACSGHKQHHFAVPHWARTRSSTQFSSGSDIADGW